MGAGTRAREGDGAKSRVNQCDLLWMGSDPRWLRVRIAGAQHGAQSANGA